MYIYTENNKYIYIYNLLLKTIDLLLTNKKQILYFLSIFILNIFSLLICFYLNSILV
jgi:hypothetical protein